MAVKSKKIKNLERYVWKPGELIILPKEPLKK